MRGFMRALGLGGLFRRSHAASDMRGSVLRPVSNTFLDVLDGKSSPSSARQMSAVARALVGPQSARQSRGSSIEERPQFLFFCGSESIAERTPSIANARMNATLLRDSIREVAAPVISHRMPVFFAAQCAFSMHSPTAADGVRPRASIFD
ncbi:hypothetical protein PybrP1_006217 [[Pythium] brassicae (nom. inval.)]|nr:hypothetical protein PybrP1_006217 [[Pythium] brassicae (nom. inval.)]